MKMSGAFDRIRTEAHDLHPRDVHERVQTVHAGLPVALSPAPYKCLHGPNSSGQPGTKVRLSLPSQPKGCSKPLAEVPLGFGSCLQGLGINKCVAFRWDSWQAEQSRSAELGSQSFIYYRLAF